MRRQNQDQKSKSQETRLRLEIKTSLGDDSTAEHKNTIQILVARGRQRTENKSLLLKNHENKSKEQRLRFWGRLHEEELKLCRTIARVERDRK
jgi:hypothetical protein